MKRISDSDYQYDTIDYKDYTIEINYEQNAPNPFEEWDEMPTVYSNGGNFGLGEKLNRGYNGLYDDENYEEFFENCYFIAFECNSYTGRCTETENLYYADGFLVWKKRDWEKVGSSIDPYEDLRANLKLLSDYCEGNVYWYQIISPDGTELDTCGGFYGDDGLEDGISEAESIIDADIKEVEEWERGREDREFDEFWAKRGDISDSYNF